MKLILQEQLLTSKLLREMHHYADDERNTQRRGAEHIPHVHLRLLLSLKRRY
jgi:hypothetical protein